MPAQPFPTHQAFRSVQLMLQLAAAASPETVVLLMPRSASNGHVCLCIQMGAADLVPGKLSRSKHCSSSVQGPWHWLVCPVGQHPWLHSPRAPGNRDYLTPHCCPLCSKHQAGHCFLPSHPIPRHPVLSPHPSLGMAQRAEGAVWLH